VVGELIRALIQLGVGEALVLEHHRDGVGCALHLGLEELMQTQGGGVRLARVVPAQQHLLALGAGQDRQLADGAGGLDHDAFQQRDEALGQAARGLFVEEIGVVLEVAAQGSVVGLLDGEQQIELGSARIRVEQGDGQTADLEGRQRRVHQHEHHLEQR
jgi:hypothetical protein